MALEKRYPEQRYFGDFRKRLKTKDLMNVFTRVRESLKNRDLIREVFTFVDVIRLLSKLTTWDDRDKVMKTGLRKLNNETIAKLATDTRAHFGSEGNNTFWYGYKEHVSVDMQSGLINEVAASSAEKSDAEGLSPVCPNRWRGLW